MPLPSRDPIRRTFTKISAIFAMHDISEIGLYLSGRDGSLPSFGMGMTVAIFQAFGSSFSRQERLINARRVLLLTGPRFFRNSEWILSGPGAFRGLHFLRASSSSLAVKLSVKTGSPLTTSSFSFSLLSLLRALLSFLRARSDCGRLSTVWYRQA